MHARYSAFEQQRNRADVNRMNGIGIPFFDFMLSSGVERALGVTILDARLCSAMILVVSGTLFSGCLDITERTIPGGMSRQEETAVDAGPPQVRAIPHPDRQGWTVHATQPMVRHLRVLRASESLRVHYYVNPLALPAGLFACPSTLWGWAFSVLDHSASIEYRRALIDLTVESCLMALMIVRTKAQGHIQNIVVEEQDVPSSRPTNGGQAVLSWHGPQAIEVYYPIEDGKAVIRLHHLATALQQAGIREDDWSNGQANLAVRNHDVLVGQWPVAGRELRNTLRERPAVAARDRWPTTPVFTLRVEGDPVHHTYLEGQMRTLLLRLGLTQVGPESASGLLRLELIDHLSGMVDDHAAPRVGHWLAPTVLVVIRTDTSPQSSSVALTLLKIDTREVLGVIQVHAGPNDLPLAIDVALGQLEDALAVAGFHRAS